MKRLLWVAPYLVLLGSAGGAADRPATQAADQAPLPVDKLVEEFQTNEVRAEALYTGKTIEVSGRLARVITARYGPPGQAGKDAYVVELRTKPLDLSRIAVHFYFDEAERDRLARLVAGRDVVIRGECGRLVVYTGEYKRGEKDYTEVRFHGCKVIDPK